MKLWVKSLNNWLKVKLTQSWTSGDPWYHYLKNDSKSLGIFRCRMGLNCVRIWACVWVCVRVCFSLSLLLSLSLSLSLSPCLFLSFCWSLSCFLSLSLFISMSVCLCVCVSVCLCTRLWRISSNSNHEFDEMSGSISFTVIHAQCNMW